MGIRSQCSNYSVTFPIKNNTCFVPKTVKEEDFALPVQRSDGSDKQGTDAMVSNT